MSELLKFKDADGVEISYRRWLPGGEPRAIVQIAHGACEHSLRYERFAKFLTGRGYAVYANDHRGHGETAKATGVGRAGPRGWDGMIDDLREFGTVARGDLGELPLVLFGHSMGSFLSQLFAQRYGGDIDGLVLSGTAGAMEGAAEGLPLLEAMAATNADDAVPDLGPFNADFEPARTPSDWLSRDEAEVDLYEADPMCGARAPLTIGFVLDMLRHALDAWTPEAEKRIPDDLPILFITGEADPVSQRAKTVRELEARYRSYGVKDVSALYYPEARHELLNEINRGDVHEDVASWLDRVTAR